MFPHCDNNPVLKFFNKKNKVWMIKESVKSRGRRVYQSEHSEMWGTGSTIPAERRTRVPFPLKCREMQRPRLQDLPYCRHMALRWDTVCVRVCKESKRRGKAFVSATWICPRALWVITEKQSSSTNSASLELIQNSSVDAEISSSSGVIMCPG